MKNYTQQIVNYISQDYSNKQLLGLEVEHFILDKNNKSLVYNQIKKILLDLSKYYTKQEISNGEIIGLEREDAHVSLEPGAQLEVAISAKESIEEIDVAYKKFLNELEQTLNKFNYKICTLGYRPDKCALEVPIIPKNRYIAMDSRFKTIDELGPCMMRNTTSTQISIDFKDEQDCYEKLKCATALAPIIYFLYDNSPIFEKKPIERMARYKVWQHTDPDRCGSLRTIFEKNFSIKKYVNEATKLPLVYSRSYMKNLYNKKLATKIGDDIFYGPYSTDDIIDGDANLTKKEINQILTMIFYDARLKNLIELRGADSMPKDFVISYCALIKYLFYDNFKLTKSLFLNTSYTEYINAGEELFNKGWDADIYGQKITDILDKFVNTNDKNLIPTNTLIENRLVLKDHLKHNIKLKDTGFNPISKTIENTNKQIKCNNIKDLYNIHTKSKAEYWDEIVNMGYFAKQFDIYNTTQFSDICATLHKILTKVIKEYYANPEYKKLFKYSKFEQNLIDIQPEYSELLPMARFDIFFDDATGKFQICEFNTGGSAAMNEVSYLCEEISKADTYKKLNNPKEWNLYDPWVEAFLNNYYEVRKNKPVVAIVDYLDDCEYVDFPLFKEAFERHNIECHIVDIRELTYNKYLYWKDIKIDAVYKRVTLNDLKPEDNALIEAVKNKSVVSIDWFSTQIVHDKQICRVLFHEKTKDILTRSEWNFIKLHMPKLYAGDNKDNYIAKPISSRGAANIYVGNETDQDTWNKLVKDNNYLIQEYCQQYYSPNRKIDVKKPFEEIPIQNFSNMDGLYCYNGKFSGVYLRQGTQSINAQKYDNIVCATFYEEQD